MTPKPPDEIMDAIMHLRAYPDSQRAIDLLVAAIDRYANERYIAGHADGFRKGINE
jgi:hypothetical protein